jgi:transposase
MGAPPKADWREERRKRAWVLKQNGWPQKQIAAALGVSEGAISQWMRRAREGGGVEALTRRPPPGMTPRLSMEQRAQLPALLARGAPAYGFAGDVWTATRVAVVIERTFGVRYSRDSVSRLLRACGWSRQQPSTRATQRDEAAIRRWQEERWPTRKKGRTRREPPSSGETNRAFLCCRWRSAPGRPRERPRSCACPSRLTISRSSAPSP